mmetsp:Transcript_15200/g.38362  ORF Transcript_15200/g.38362 Transcript_15200/m.38362 type:complete len:222 (-) Transcript_15200:1077-1742(-)
MMILLIINHQTPEQHVHILLHQLLLQAKHPTSPQISRHFHSQSASKASLAYHYAITRHLLRACRAHHRSCIQPCQVLQIMQAQPSRCQSQPVGWPLLIHHSSQISIHLTEHVVNNHHGVAAHTSIEPNNLRCTAWSHRRLLEQSWFIAQLSTHVHGKRAQRCQCRRMHPRIGHASINRTSLEHAWIHRSHARSTFDTLTAFSRRHVLGTVRIQARVVERKP